MTFTMDTSAFIGAWDRAYPPDVFPGLWEAFDQMVADGDLRAIEEVGVELRRKSDALRDWANGGSVAAMMPPGRIAATGVCCVDG